MTPWTVACQAPLSMGFFNWSRLPCPPPGDLPRPEIEPMSPAFSKWILYHWATRKAHDGSCGWSDICRCCAKEILSPSDDHYLLPMIGWALLSFPAGLLAWGPQGSWVADRAESLMGPWLSLLVEASPLALKFTGHEVWGVETKILPVRHLK